MKNFPKLTNRIPLEIKMPLEQEHIFQLIDEILWKERDPIGVNDIEAARDEYRSYVTRIFRLKIHGADKVKIAKHLFRVETIDMGLSGSYKHCEKIAERILNL